VFVSGSTNYRCPAYLSRLGQLYGLPFLLYHLVLPWILNKGYIYHYTTQLDLFIIG
jgi:hypothetical protein